MRERECEGENKQIVNERFEIRMNFFFYGGAVAGESEKEKERELKV